MPRVKFTPNWCSSPGSTIGDILNERLISLTDFAGRIKRTRDYVNDLLLGRVTITVELATQLQNTLGGSVAFWLNRDLQYREDFDRFQRAVSDLAAETWLRELPLKDMIKFGWLESCRSQREQLAACIRFFDVPDIESWRREYREIFDMAAFRTSPTFNSMPGSVAAWLRQGTINARSIDCAEWNSERFREALSEIRFLTRKKDPDKFIPKLVEICAKCGVAIVILRGPDGCRASGATRFLSSKKAMMLLSFRYLSDDQFWFTIFHEAGHLLLHGQSGFFLEGVGMESKKEQEASEFAARILIPNEFHSALSNLGMNSRDIIRFARLVGVSPGIVVGQLQHSGKVARNRHNRLKRRFRWVNKKE